jgi:hypothetical protein
MASAAGTVIEGGNTIQGTFGPIRNAGAPVAGTNEVWTLTIGGTPSAGATSGIKFNYQGLVSALCLWSATSATFVTNLQACLDAFFGSGATVVSDGTSTNGVGTFIITFSGALLAKRSLGAVATITNLLTGTSPTASAARTTPGVDATARGIGVGGKLLDITNAFDYVNTGTSAAPTFTKTGTQT